MKEQRPVMMPTTIPTLQCPKCGWNLAFGGCKVDIFPYIHADVFTHCLQCKIDYTFGIPADPLAGMTQYIFSEDKFAAAKAFENTDHPLCPFDKLEMEATKYFAWYNLKAPILQFKCRKCFLVRHIQIGTAEPNPNQMDPLVEERLRMLGYIE